MRYAKIEQFLDQVKSDVSDIVSDLPEILTTGFHTLFLLERKKDGGNNKEERRTFNFAVVTDKDNLIEKLREYLWLRYLQKDKELRIYLSVNARNPHRATRNILDTILDGLYADDINRSLIERKVLKGARSYIMNPNAKASSLFLFDVDNIVGRDVMGETLREMADLKVVEIYRKSTRNGWHIITEPFNLTLWKGQAEIKTDGLLLLK